MRVVSIVGARPQFIKAAPVSRALRELHEEVLVHSGQHFDAGMSDVFFSELGIPKPDYNLGVGGAGHGRMTGEMLGLLDELLGELAPDRVLVFGDTNTTLAGALAAAKRNVPLAHVEAGLRSFDRSMPEEVNRVVTDHVSALLFCPTDVAVANLAAEGITAGVSQVGDVMLDAARLTAERVDVEEVLGRYQLEREGYYLATVHRQATSDDRDGLSAVIDAFGRLDAPVLFSVHPRTAANITTFGLQARVDALTNVRAVPPVPYLDASALLRGARALLTDSGGMQKEAYFFRVPCVTLRDTTEWVETVETGWNVLVGTEADVIVAAAVAPPRGEAHPDFYGDAHAAERIAAGLAELPS